MVDLDEVEQAHAGGEAAAAELVGRVQRELVAAAEVAQEPDAVALAQAGEVPGHRAPSFPGRNTAPDVMTSSRAIPSSRSSAVVRLSADDAQPHHREGDVGLDADDDGLRAAQACDLRDGAQGVAGEGVDHVERGDVDDHSAGTLPPDLFQQLAAEAEELAVVECGVDGRDEVAALRQDRDAQRLLGGGG